MTFLSFMISTYRLLLRICWLPRWRRRCATLVTGSCRIVLFMHIKVKEVECMEPSEDPPKSDVKSQSGGRFQGNAEKP